MGRTVDLCVLSASEPIKDKTMTIFALLRKECAVLTPVSAEEYGLDPTDKIWVASTTRTVHKRGLSTTVEGNVKKHCCYAHPQFLLKNKA